ncbi:saccharopine dehydrogenase [Planoprotostelium fungivorum]|uniref:Saccharopine dehydrogenase n=1 Tax=Planoprotostelium fungivorum TaxID=1890364 RepID=A0A2P6N081_9EUKA|nr:saccharopine dehydrogenase [Planoprotostelium fungivorum]
MLFVFRETKEKSYLEAGKEIYTEVLSTPDVFVSGVVFVVMIVAGLLLSVSFSRNIIKKFVPTPGTGPTRKIIESGKWATHYIAKGRTPDGREVTVRGRAKGHQDPGYNDTARMLSESAVHLALSRDKCAERGFCTPAAAYGPTFIDRLRTAGQDWIIE